MSKMFVSYSYTARLPLKPRLPPTVYDGFDSCIIDTNTFEAVEEHVVSANIEEEVWHEELVRAVQENSTQKHGWDRCSITILYYREAMK